MYYDSEARNYLDDGALRRIIKVDSNNPHEILGCHKTEDGFVITCVRPDAESVQVKISDDETYYMDKLNDDGIFSIHLPIKEKFDYTYIMRFPDGNTYETEDAYNFESQITMKEVDAYKDGSFYNSYEKLGAHKVTINGVDGVYFAVWAPNARKVSVIGSFNAWNGRTHLMRKIDAGGIFELFIPRISDGEVYKYEIKGRRNNLLYRTDPYGNYAEMRPQTASIVADLDSFEWNDKKWILNREKDNSYENPMAIYEVHLGSWRKDRNETENGFKNYRDLAKELADYVLDMGYTHVELMGIAEHPFDGSWGYQVTGYYAPTSRFGKPEDFMYFVNYLHNKGIGVILDWVPAHFPKDPHGLERFDGDSEYEHPDSRRGEHPDWGTYIFNYGRNEVSNFLISNALFWVDKFHIDALRVDAVASMLYLDYGKRDGEWLPNELGGKENFEAIDFMKKLNSIIAEKFKGAMLMAEESTAWPHVTGEVKSGGLGFKYKWNMGWMNDFLHYMSLDPYFRQFNHNELTFSFVYAFSEKYILVLSHDEVVHLKKSMLEKMPGNMHDKFSNLRLAYGFMFAHPGKKLLFMGQDFGQHREWSEARELDWFLLEKEEHKELQHYVKDLLHFYKQHTALYVVDHDASGFEWINGSNKEVSIITFVRKTPDGRGSLLFVCNFTPVARPEFRVGVPNRGNYKLCFNSDDKEYGGTGEFLKKNTILKTKKIEWDGRENSIAVDVPPLSITVFEYNHSFTKNKKKKVQ